MKLEGKHKFGEISGKRGTIIEKGISKERMEFLKSLLEFNGFEVLVQEDKRKNEEAPLTFTIGVTDLIFNPTIWIYARKLKMPDGRIVNQDLWFQVSKKSSPQYWEKKYGKI